MALYPLEPVLIAKAALALALELLLFVLVTWIIDAGLTLAVRKFSLAPRRD
jgi:hypothetical protein